MKKQIPHFKSWDTKNLKWIDDFLVSRYGKIIFIENDGYEYVNHNAILVRFTGLYDSKKKPIYEGDVVQGQFVEYDPCADEYIKREKMGGVVFWSYSGWEFRAIESMCDKDRDGMVNYFGFTDHNRFSSHFSNMKVLGSSIEKPELIK